MGGFVAVLALRDVAADAAADAVVRYAARHSVPAQRLPSRQHSADGAVDTADGWAPVNGWTVVLWPNYFTGLQPAAQWLAADLGTIVSSISYYDGDFWNHVLWRDGIEVDRFSSWPDYFTKNRVEARSLRQTWTGRPDVVASVVGRRVDQIAPYLLHPHSSGFFGRLVGRRKPLPGDQFELADPWVFTDFWRRLGITYPNDAEPAWSVQFPAGHANLPSGGPEL